MPLSDADITNIGKIPPILDGKFFRIIHFVEGKIQAKCMNCGRTYNGTLKSTSNFLKHIAEKHATLRNDINTKIKSTSYV